MNWEIGQLINRIELGNLSQSELTQLLAGIVSHMKSRSMINACLAEMASKEWTILYKAVLEVEAGL